MANNFRITGDYYVSKEGSDANSGLTPDLPKLTVQAALTLITGSKIIVIGAGVYREPLLKAMPTGTTTILADGKVILEGDGVSTVLLSALGTTVLLNIYNIEFRNYSIVQFAGTGFSANSLQLYGCIFMCPVFVFNSQLQGTFTQCLFVNSEIRTRESAYTVLNKCILINSYINPLPSIGTGGGIGSLLITNTYSDSNSVLNVNVSGIASGFNFNNIQGKIIMNTGTYSGIALSFADHRTFYPTFNLNSISTSPLFNNAQNLNFTLQSGSPHIRAASDFVSNIGGTEYAVYKAANSTELTSGATITDLTLRGDNSYAITPPATDGRIITAPISVQAFPATKPLTKIEWEGSLEFNKSITGGLAGNQNVPAYTTFTSGGGATPDRLKCLMRYSTQSASPTAGQWDNGGYWTVDTWVEVEINTKPKVDQNGVGNGTWTFIDFTGLGDLVPCWIQLDIKLRNDYNI